MIGAVADAEGLFAALGARAEALRGGPLSLLAAMLGLDAVVTAILNLDTAVVFVTPIALHAAHRRGCDERPFLYGALLMANGASLLLPGSNLTNLIVLAHTHTAGAGFARAMILPWLTVVLLTIGFVAAVFRPRGSGRERVPPPPIRLGVGLVATLAAAALILALPNAALPVFALGLLAAVISRLRPRIDAPVLAGLFVLAVSLGTLARRWDWPAGLVGRAGAVGAAVLGAGAAVAVNNLPAAALLSARHPPHPLPLLIGLDLGPNLAFTGSLSAFLWWRTARSLGSSPSLGTLSALGVLLTPLSIAAALAVLALVDPGAV
jgi:arsenical pump membrane protein